MAALNAPVTFGDAEVFHVRTRANGVRFRYRVPALVIDLDGLDETPASLPFFSVGGFNLFGFHAVDHGPRDGSPLRDHVDRLHAQYGLARPERVRLVCFPRILGFVFNPIATYVCEDAAGRVTSAIYEVRNTFGEQHAYLMPVRQTAAGAVAPHECDKLLYVSPFMDMPLRYRFLLSPPRDGRFDLKIIERDQQGVALTALMRVKAFEATRLALVRRILGMPLLGFTVLAAIHRQALTLWLKGHALRPRPAPPAPTSMAAPGEFSDPPFPVSSGGSHA